MSRTHSKDNSNTLPLIGPGSPDVLGLARNIMRLPPEQTGTLAAQLATELVERSKESPFYLNAMIAAHGSGVDAATLAQAYLTEAEKTGRQQFAYEGDYWHLLAALRLHQGSAHYLFDKMSNVSFSPAEFVAGDYSPPAGPIDEEQSEEPNSAAAPAVPGRVVLARIGDSSSKEGADLSRRYRGVIGSHIPYAGSVPSAGAVAKAIRSKWPWAEDVARFLEGRVSLMRVSHAGFVRLPPILLVGDTGSGKTSIAIGLAAALGLPSTMVACGGVSDSGGLTATARGWTTSRPCAPFQAIVSSHAANPLVVLDELDKGTPARSQNGSVWASALGLLDQSERYYDPCLLAEVDLSAVSYVATANHIDVLPPELTDRFLVLKVPRPRPEDFDIVLEGAMQSEAASMQTLRDLLPELDRHDKAFLREMFGKRRQSLRSFRKMVTMLIGEKASVAALKIIH